MKIVSVRAAGLSGSTPRGGWATDLRPHDDVHTVVSVHTDDGLVGLGSVFTSYALVSASLAILTTSLLGAELSSPTRMTEDLHQRTFWQGRGGAITHTISGINIALWDLYGQMLNRPVWELLGGGHRDRVRPYASLLMDTNGEMERTIDAQSQVGFTAFKIGWGPFGRVDAHTDRDIIARARRAAGDEAMLAVDAGGSDAYWPHGFKWATETAKMLADYKVAWFEEALPPDDLAGYAALRHAAPVSISGGEVLTRRQAFAPFIEAGCFDVVQPDVTKVGGIDESLAVGRTAEDHSIRMIPHGWNTAIGLAADLHLAAALPGTDLVEYCTGSAYIDDIVDGQPWDLDTEGYIHVPDGPGLGIKLEPDRLNKFTFGDDLGIPL